MTCDQGTFRKGKKCIQCPPGTYQNETSATACKPCPRGYYNPTPGAVGIDLCRPCPASTFLSTPGASSRAACKPCPRGTDSVSGSYKCISCPAGTYISKCVFSNVLDFIPVPIGNVGLCPEYDSYRDQYDFPTREEVKCRPCPSFTFSAKRNSKRCTPCPFGESSSEKATKCVLCEPGTGQVTFRNLKTVICRPCTDNPLTGRTTCNFCQPGFIPEKKGTARAKCIPCPPQTARPANKVKCIRCKPGENTNIRGASFCAPDDTPCADNFFRTKQGACSRCEKNFRLDPRRKQCVPCRNGEVSEGGIVTKCTKCPVGSVVSATSKRGCKCKPGLVFSRDFKCVPCPKGTFKRGRDNEPEVCSECKPGTFAPRTGMAECMLCPKGYAQHLTRQSKCDKCVGGLVPQVPNHSKCVDPRTNCRPTEKREVFENGVLRCQQIPSERCPPGTYKEVYTSGSFQSATCGLCTAGQRYNPKRMTCVECDEQSFAYGAAKVCTKCPGRLPFNFDFGCSCYDRRIDTAGNCARCAPGTAPDGVFGCLRCPPGYFATRFECKVCRKGTFSKGGAKSCSTCPVGTTTFGLGESSCVKVGASA